MTGSIKYIAASLLLANISFGWTCVLVNATEGLNSETENKPNIVIILADDLGTGDVPGYWNSGKVDMPNVEDLIRKGTIFTDAHSTPLCAPSRYMLLSGNYPFRGRHPKGTWSLNNKGTQFLPKQRSIARALSKYANYHTAVMGKWHLGAKLRTESNYTFPPNWELDPSNILRNPDYVWSKPMKSGPLELGFDYSFISHGGIQSPPFVFFRNGIVEIENQDLSNVTYWDKGEYSMPEGLSKILIPGEGSPNWDSTAYNMIVVNETARFLDDHMDRRPDDPFFAYVSLGAVHDPHSPPNRYFDGSPVAGQQPSDHMDLIGEIDKVVGSIVQMLDERRLLSNTLIVFTSDNGGLNVKKTIDSGHLPSGKLKGHKGTIYEGGHRIPLIMRWDGGTIAKNESYPHLVGLNDLYATLCDFAGIDVPYGQAMDSISFADSLGKDQGPRRYLYTYHYVKYKNLLHQSIRQDNFKLVLFNNKRPMQLFDLDNDISEEKNLIWKFAYRHLVKDMLEEFYEIDRCSDSKRWFYISKMGSTKSCKYMEKRKVHRCNRFSEAREKCPLTCHAPDNIIHYCSLSGMSGRNSKF